MTGDRRETKALVRDLMNTIRAPASTGRGRDGSELRPDLGYLGRGSRIKHQLRRRVDVLHRVHARDFDCNAYLANTEAFSNESVPSVLMTRIVESVIDDLWPAAPINVRHRVHELTRWALRSDSSTDACVQFAVEHLRARTLAELHGYGITWNSAIDGCLKYIVPGVSCGQPQYTVLTEDEIDSVRKIAVRSLTRSPETTSSWGWKFNLATANADVSSPPVEALALAAGLAGSIVDGNRTPAHPNVIAVGLGFALGLQVLSAALQGRVYSDPYPIGGQRIPQGKWDTVVLNIPTAGALKAFAAMNPSHISESDDKPLALTLLHARDLPKDCDDHVPAMIARALTYMRPGSQLVLLAEPEIYWQAADILEANGFHAAKTPVGTSPYFVGYRSKPRGFWILPRPTDRLVSVWRRS